MNTLTRGAAALVVGLCAGFGPAAQAQSLDTLLPVIEELATQDEGEISDREIQERSLERGAGEFLKSGEPDASDVFHSYMAYQDEKRRLEEQERRRKAEKRRKTLQAIGGFLGSMRK